MVSSSAAVLCCVILLLAAVICCTEACSCLPLPSKQQRFCDAQIVLKASIKRRAEIGSFMRYKVEFQDFKGHPIKTRKVWTPNSNEACGAFGLQLNTTYLLQASWSEVNDRYETNICGWIQEFSDLTEDEILGINGAWTCPQPAAAAINEEDPEEDGPDQSAIIDGLTQLGPILIG